MLGLLLCFSLCGCTQFSSSRSSSFSYEPSVFANESNILFLSGSSSVYPIIEALKPAFLSLHSSSQIFVNYSTSSQGIIDLVSGNSTFAMSSREIDDEEYYSTLAKGVDLYMTPIALDVVVLATGSFVGSIYLSLDEVRQIFSGEVSNWNEVGGPNCTLVIYGSDPERSGTARFFFDKLNVSFFPSSYVTLNKTSDVIYAVRNDVCSIGFSSRHQITSEDSFAFIEGKNPFSENVFFKHYPFTRTLYLVTNGHPKGLSDEFLRFILLTESQQKIEAMGYVSIG